MKTAFALIVALFLVLPGAAQAAKTPTTVNLLGGGANLEEEPQWEIPGELESSKNACLKNRTVTVTKVAELDQTTSANDGTFSLAFPLSGNQEDATYDVTVKKRKIGQGDRRRTCKADSATLTITRDQATITIEFDDGIDQFFGEVSYVNPECLLETSWGLFQGSLENPPIVFQAFDGAETWSYSYGAEAPPGEYTVGTSFGSTGSPGAGGGYDLTACASGIDSLML